MAELYKGNDILDSIMHRFPYREALKLRDTRIARLKREREEAEQERRKQESAQANAQARSKIMMPH